MKTISGALFWPISNKYVYKIQKGREMHRYVKAGILLFVCYHITKAYMKIYINILGTQYFVLLDATRGAQYRCTTRACT